ncbi:sugar phosphate isomerase/epimerase [Kribbella sandramycini]|uniref:Sugar phosphate isomerase/epimerase n=1 Tax=Kribbella sandramycini TaxID=60450 RepID=A0A7Y4P189_9ACTN|nr:TIM barrel protein [Kribbella sandramycini]MBB6565590.1 sugar phosphate isomerase/epimerase [Kribbella sandramycini]NOL41854.1 sugar phosphate isomerase/epimerase [Kribbella sandramycini]
MAFAFSTLGCPGAPLDQVLKLAEGNDIGGLELRAAPDEFTNTALTAAERRTLRNRIEDAGLEILAISSYVKLCAVEEQPLDAHLELAADLGARGVRVFPGDDPGTPDSPSAGEIRALDRVTQAAKTSRILLETHDSHSAGAKMAALLTLIDNSVSDHNVRVIWDSAHTWSHGETPAEAFALLRPWLEFVQIKQSDSAQAYRPVAVEAGDYPIQQLLEALAGSEYPLSLEWETKWHPHLPPLEETLPAVTRWLSVAP